MKNKKIVYSVFKCDQWRSTNSMTLAGIYTNQEKIIKDLKKNCREEIEEAIENGGIESFDDINFDDLEKQKIPYIHITTSYLNNWEG